jgi:hypothetical protein
MPFGDDSLSNLARHEVIRMRFDHRPLRFLTVLLLLSFRNVLASESPLALPETYQLDTDALSLATGDFDGDGDPDVAVLLDTHRVQLFQNDGAGTLRLWTLLDGFPGEVMHVVDLDHDGHLDLLGAGEEGLVFFRGSNDGTFDPIPVGPQTFVVSAVAFGDANRDGWLDVAIGDRRDTSITVLYGARRLSFPKQWKARVPLVPTAMAFGDADGDRRIELAVQLRPNPDQVLPNEMSGELRIYRRASEHSLRLAAVSPSRNWLTRLEFLDLDGDGSEELFEADDRLLWFRRQVTDVGAADIPFRTLLEFATSPRVLVADIDGDGNRDRLYNEGRGEYSGLTLLFGENGHMGSVSPVRVDLGGIALGNDWVADPQLVDLNRDGRLDIVSLTYRNRSLAIVRNLGGREFGAITRQPTEPQAQGIRSGDLDGDGTPEIIVRASGGISAAKVRADGQLSPPRFLHSAIRDPGTYPDEQWCQVADLDRDRRSDLMLRDGRDVLVALTRSDGGLAPDQIIGPGRLIGSGDVDGDGDPDIVTVGDGGSIQLWPNRGDGVFEAFRVIGTVPQAESERCATVGDIDGNGRSEVVFVASSIESLWVMQALPGGAVEIRGYELDLAELSEIKRPHLIPRQVTVQDLDHLGSNEAVVRIGLSGDEGLAVVLGFAGAGDPRLTDWTYLPREFPSNLEFADFDQDGFLDFANTSNEEGHQVRLHVAFNDRAGHFSNGPALTVTGSSNGALGVTSGDFDGDGDPDLAILVAGTTSNGIDDPSSIGLVFNRSSAEVATPEMLTEVQAKAPGQAEFAIRTSSNPARGEIVLRYRTNGESSARVDLYDVSGRRVKQIGVLPSREGEGMTRLPAKDLEPGVYWVRLTQASRSTATRIVVLRP